MVVIHIGHSHADSITHLISQNFVTFTPDILKEGYYYPCRGIKLSTSVLLMGKECSSLVSQQILSGHTVKVHNSEGRVFASIRLMPGVRSEQGELPLKVLEMKEKEYHAPLAQHGKIACMSGHHQTCDLSAVHLKQQNKETCAQCIHEQQSLSFTCMHEYWAKEYQALKKCLKRLHQKTAGCDKICIPLFVDSQ